MNDKIITCNSTIKLLKYTYTKKNKNKKDKKDGIIPFEVYWNFINMNVKIISCNSTIKLLKYTYTSKIKIKKMIKMGLSPLKAIGPHISQLNVFLNPVWGCELLDSHHMAHRASLLTLDTLTTTDGHTGS